MSLPTVQSHVADITNVDVNTISFDLPASIPLGAGIICLIGAWDDDGETVLAEDLTPALIKASKGSIRTVLGLVDALGVQ